MSLIVKGMRLPKHCRNCKFSYFVRGTTMKCLFINEACRIKGRLDDCPLVEIPTPRGRLIDADELTKHMRSYYPSIDHLCRSQHVVTKGDIDNAPTIIGAENSSAIDDDVKKYCDYLKSETYDFCNRIENGEVSEE